MTALTTTSKSSPPSVNQPVSDLVDRFKSALGLIPGTIRQFEIAATSAPSDEQRRQLAVRREEVVISLQAASSEAIGRYIASLKAVLPSRTLDEDGAAMELRLTVKALENLPEWAIASVCRKFLDGRLGNGRFAPTPAEIAQACRLLLVEHQQEAATIEHILKAKVYEIASDEERARVKAVMTGVAAELRAASVGGLGMTDDQKEAARIERLRPEDRQSHFAKVASKLAAEFRETPPIASDALRKMMATQVPIRQQAAE